jgi:hypothetical protein
MQQFDGFASRAESRRRAFFSLPFVGSGQIVLACLKPPNATKKGGDGLPFRSYCTVDLQF